MHAETWRPPLGAACEPDVIMTAGAELTSSAATERIRAVGMMPWRRRLLDIMPRSEIRSVRDRHVVVELQVVLRANFFLQWLLYPLVALDRRPGFVEGVRIVSGEIHLHCLAAVNHSPALHDMQFLGVGRAEGIHEGPFVHPDGVGHQRVGLVMADR